MAALRTLLLATLALSPLPACTMVSIPVTVGPNFQVRLASGDRGIPHLPLILRPILSNAPPSHATTDSQGLASFKAVLPGEYTLAPLHASGAAISILVSPSLAFVKTVLFAWPSPPFISTAALRGRIEPLVSPPYSLTLRDPRTGQTLRHLPSAGPAFDFPDLAPGLYLLDLKGPLPSMNGTIALAVDPAASPAPLALSLSFSSCGLAATDLNQCRYPPLALPSLAGHVLDSAGASIPNATITLLDPNDSPLQSTQSGPAGAFSIPTPPPAPYYLQIASPAFALLRLPLTLDPAAPPATLEAKLDPLSGCGAVRLLPTPPPALP